LAPYIYAMIIFAIGAAALAEILTAREKKQMKKQFLKELDRLDYNQKSDEDESNKAN
jgi:hypothetical protein